MNQTSMNGSKTAQTLLTLTCPSCGSKLKVTEQVHLLVCANCGNEYMVHRDGGAVYLGPIAQDVKQIRVGVDKTAAELAVARLTKEISAVNDELEDAKRQDYTHLIATSNDETLFFIGIIATGILTLVCVATGQSAASLVFLSLLIPLVFFHSRAGKKRRTKIELVRNTEIERLESIFISKKAALRKQHDIANN